MLQHEVRDYLTSPDGPFTDDQLELLKEHGCWVAGGAIASLLCARDIRDVDVYVPSFDAALALAENSILISSSAKALVCAPKGTDIPPVQIIFDRYYTSAQQIFDAFDFTVCMAAYSFADDKLHMHDEFLQDNMARRLTFNRRTLYPIMSHLRVEKYKGYGYDISQLENLKILTAIAQLDMKDLNDLKQQIGGMYGSMMDVTNVETLDDFFDAHPLLVEQGTEVSTEDHHLSRLIRKEYPFLNKILVKSVKLKDGVYESSIVGEDRTLKYPVGTTLDTNEISGGNRCRNIYASHVEGYLPGSGDAHVLQLNVVERYPLEGTGTSGQFVNASAVAGKFEIKKHLCSLQEWREKALSERIAMVQS